MSLLDDILASKRREIAVLREGRVEEVAQASLRTPLDVVRALARPAGAPLRLVAEVKLRSPSAGALSRAMNPPTRAAAYAEAGATMISVLCDGPFFEGSFDDLSRARARLDAGGFSVPLLAKEFVLDGAQVARAHASGADAVLLIARIVTADELTDLARDCRARGMEPLVEVTDEAELARALAAEARVVGVNARDLDTLTIDKARAARVLAAVPSGVVAVHLSGLGTPEAIGAVAASRSDAALVGEALMRQDDPRELLAAMVRAAAGG